MDVFLGAQRGDYGQVCAPIACECKGRQTEILGSLNNGFICQTEDIDGLAKSITKIVNDDVLRSRM